MESAAHWLFHIPTINQLQPAGRETGHVTHREAEGRRKRPLRPPLRPIDDPHRQKNADGGEAGN